MTGWKQRTSTSSHKLHVRSTILAYYSECSFRSIYWYSTNRLSWPI